MNLIALVNQAIALMEVAKLLNRALQVHQDRQGRQDRQDRLGRQENLLPMVNSLEQIMKTSNCLIQRIRIFHF